MVHDWYVKTQPEIEDLPGTYSYLFLHWKSGFPVLYSWVKQKRTKRYLCVFKVWRVFFAFPLRIYWKIRKKELETHLRRNEVKNVTLKKCVGCLFHFGYRICKMSRSAVNYENRIHLFREIENSCRVIA